MKVTVIIPTCRTRPFIYEAIASILNQTIKPDEIIIVDDSGEPNNPRITKIEETYKEVPNFKIVHNEKNMGIGFSRQRGVEEATGDYICFLSSDDLWEPTYLEIMIKEAEKHPGKILYSKYYSFYSYQNYLFLLGIQK